MGQNGPFYSKNTLLGTFWNKMGTIVWYFSILAQYSLFLEIILQIISKKEQFKVYIAQLFRKITP